MHELHGSVQANPAKLQPEWEELTATSCAVQNMFLTTHALGVAGMFYPDCYAFRSVGDIQGYGMISFYLVVVNEHALMPCELLLLLIQYCMSSCIEEPSEGYC